MIGSFKCTEEVHNGLDVLVTKRFVTECPINVHQLGVFSGCTHQIAVGDVYNFVASSTNIPHFEFSDEKNVRWSSLGLSSGMKEVKKLISNDKFQYTTIYKQIFIDDLGCDNYSYYGFSLLDSKFLHTKEQVYMEMSSHLNQIKLYIYSLVTHNILLNHYDMEFIIHGFVELTLNRYVESVYGIHDRNYRYQKMHDTVIHLDSSGYALPLFPQMLTEQFERLSLHFVTYMKYTDSS